MRNKHLAASATLCATLLLNACGDSRNLTPKSEVSATRAASAMRGMETPSVLPQENAAITAEDAVRLAKQATFGPTPELVEHIVSLKSASAWIDEQLALTSSSYADLAAAVVPGNLCNGMNGQAFANCTRDNFTVVPMATRFYSNALNRDDQLRQRIAFALSQILVASDLEVHNASGLAAYNQILLEGALGNYRDLLAAITLNPFMGNYLDMVDSSKVAPNENYARELMQLFSIGTVMLNADGTPQTDNTGSALPAYSNADVKEVARALTGWTYPSMDKGALTEWTRIDYSKPMTSALTRFDTGSKQFLGKTVAASASQQANVEAVVDAVFYHPNTGPFVSKRLIQQLVTSNPTPAYVQRVATVFADNGSGVRGDMKAVVKAILLDSEARSGAAIPGKVKEPVLLATSLGRALGLKTDGYAFYARDSWMGQRPFSAPSVFNFYSYNFPLPMGDGAISPASKLMSTYSTTARHNFIYDWTILGDTPRGEYQPETGVAGATGTQPNWAAWETLAADETKLLDRINLIFLNGTMTPAQRLAITKAMAAIKNTNGKLQARNRAQVALYIIASSPMFQVDR